MAQSYRLRLGATLEFDMAREYDLVQTVKDLTKSHKLGAYINKLLRYVWENPDKFKGTPVDCSENGITNYRVSYFNEVSSEVGKLQKSLEGLYREVLVLSTAAKVGATFGLVEKADEVLLGLQAINEYSKAIRDKLDFGQWGHLISTDGMTPDPEGISMKAADILINILISKGEGRRISTKETVAERVILSSGMGETTSEVTGGMTGGKHGGVDETSVRPVETIVTAKDNEIPQDSRESIEVNPVEHANGINRTVEAMIDNSNLVEGVKNNNNLADENENSGDTGDTEDETVLDDADIDMLSKFCGI